MMPEQAVLQRSDGSVVFVVRDGNRAERRQVKLGVFRDGLAEVRRRCRGRRAGDRARQLAARRRARSSSCATPTARRSTLAPSAADASRAADRRGRSRDALRPLDRAPRPHLDDDARADRVRRARLPAPRHGPVPEHGPARAVGDRDARGRRSRGHGGGRHRRPRGAAQHDRGRALDRVDARSRARRQIRVEFELGTDLDVVAQKVRDKIDAVRRELPPEMDPPVVSDFDFNDQPILWIPFRSDAVARSRPASTCAARSRRCFETIPGVVGVQIVRAQGPRDPDLAARRRPARARALGGRRARRAAPRARRGARAASSRARRSSTASRPTPSSARSTSSSGSWSRYEDGAPVYLSDVARVEDGAEDDAHAAPLQRHSRPSASASSSSRAATRSRSSTRCPAARRDQGDAARRHHASTRTPRSSTSRRGSARRSRRPSSRSCSARCSRCSRCSCSCAARGRR